MTEIPFFKKSNLPKLTLGFFTKKTPSQVVGIDIGTSSTKVVQLRYEKERAILETYGELLNGSYLKETEGSGTGFLRWLDRDMGALLKDVLKESNITSTQAVFSIPATSSFITSITLPRLSSKEIEQAIPFEARKYVPIPISEVVLDWDILETEEDEKETKVLLVAVPREIIEKFRRVSDLAEIQVRAVEVETFSIVRSLIGHDLTPTALVNLGQQSTTIAIADQARLQASHNSAHGSQELTRALERGLGISEERAETIKREIGLSERIEERETTSILIPLVEILFEEIGRIIALYNRKAPRHVQKINLSGGGSNLKGIIDAASLKFGIEITRGNPFNRVITPAFMQPILRNIGPNFTVAVGLALHEIAS